MAKVNPETVQNELGSVDYPLSKQQLLETARDHQASQGVLSLLREIPERQYNSPADLSQELGKLE